MTSRVVLSALLATFGALKTVHGYDPAFAVSAPIYWVAAGLELVCAVALWTRWAVGTCVVVGAVFLLFSGLVWVGWTPAKSCGCLGAVRVGNAGHLALAWLTGALAVACGLGLESAPRR